MSPHTTGDSDSRMSRMSIRDRGTERSVLAQWGQIPRLNFEELRTDLDSSIDPWF